MRGRQNFLIILKLGIYLYVSMSSQFSLEFAPFFHPRLIKQCQIKIVSFTFEWAFQGRVVKLLTLEHAFLLSFTEKTNISKWNIN